MFQLLNLIFARRKLHGKGSKIGSPGAAAMEFLDTSMLSWKNLVMRCVPRMVATVLGSFAVDINVGCDMAFLASRVAEWRESGNEQFERIVLALAAVSCFFAVIFWITNVLYPIWFVHLRADDERQKYVLAGFDQRSGYRKYRYKERRHIPIAIVLLFLDDGLEVILSILVLMKRDISGRSAVVPWLNIASSICVFFVDNLYTHKE
uniref:Uncharacterized protein n=1 Tax=Minutocellus polymorphus TaxID=265543 RepID=A0A7S0FHD3_9STRA|mmetsp:Transcript_1156/g.1990  ORF Transcript_1156/g.1990 Transcript_1156/m.1990 type:complete len:206 (+) Transcript_1156:121-738(+)